MTPRSLTAIADRRLLALAGAAVAALVAFAAYLPTLDGYFLADDFGFIRIFHARPLSQFPELFVSDWSGGLWGHPLDELRPVSGLSYRLDSFLWGLNPVGYHLTNLLFHGLSAALVFLIARRVTGGSALLGLLAGLLFALSPVHVEPVAWIAARVDVISAALYLASFYLFLRSRSEGRPWLWALSFLAFAAALFSKEIAVTLPFLLLAYDLLCRRPRPVEMAAHLSYFALLGGYFFLRHLAFESTAREQMLGLDALGAFLGRQGYYLGELLPPLRPLADGAAVAVALAALAVALAASWVRGDSARARQMLFYGPVWHLLVLAPAAVSYLPESHRYLLLPSAGLAVTIALVVGSLPGRGAALAGAAALLLLVPMGLGLADYQRDWTTAARLSRQFTQRAEQVAREAPPGAAVVLDVPGTYGRAYLWAWALPFALEQPFTDARLYGRYLVVERPESYRCPFCWPRERRAEVEALLSFPGEVYLLYLDDRGDVALRALSAEEWRERVVRLQASGDAGSVLRLLDDLQRGAAR